MECSRREGTNPKVTPTKVRDSEMSPDFQEGEVNVSYIRTFGQLLVGLQLAAAGSPYDQFFASRILAIPNNGDPRSANQYAIVFTPTRNDFSYEVQYAGKNLAGGNACWKGDSAVQIGLEQLKEMKITTSAGGTVKVEANKGTETTVGGSAELNGSVNAQRDIQVNNVFGTVYHRNGFIVAREFHWRVIVYGQDGQVKYETGWNGGQGEDIRQWSWNTDCGWVKR